MSTDQLRYIEQLQTVLACLDLSLESELALYRRHHLQPSSVLALPESEEAFNTDAPEGTNSAALEDAPVQEHHLIVPGDEQTTGLETLSPPQLNRSATSAAVVGLPALAAQTTAAQSNQSAKDKDLGLKTQQGAGAGLPIEEDPETLPEPYSAEAVAKPEALERFLDPSIEDYLESSEALLKHLDQSEKTVANEKKAPAVKSSGLAFKVLGGILIIALIVGGVMALIKALSTKPDQAPTQQPLPQNSAKVPSPAVAVSASPNPSPAASGSQTESVSPAPTQPPNLAPSPSSSPDSAASSPAITPSPQQKAAPGPENPQPTPSAAIPSADFYLVVAPYQGEASLARARQLVPDAFIATVRGQQQIQLSFVESLQQAQRLVNELKNQGFASSITTQNRQ